MKRKREKPSLPSEEKVAKARAYLERMHKKYQKEERKKRREELAKGRVKSDAETSLENRYICEFTPGELDAYSKLEEISELVLEIWAYRLKRSYQDEHYIEHEIRMIRYRAESAKWSLLEGVMDRADAQEDGEAWK